jgi:pimeloyl-ACP methyl ester carboxylesterase
MPQPRLRATERDAAIRAAEAKLYAARGLRPVTSMIAVDTGFGQTQIRLTEFGGENDGVPLLLLHGIASISVLAAPLLDGLDGRRVVAVDWPGHGLSGPCVLPRGASIRAHALRVLASVMNQLDFSTVDLVGHSLGAQFSLYAALDMPEKVRRMVLLGAPGAAFPGVKPVAAMKLLAVPGLGVAALSLPLSKKMFNRTNDDLLGVGALDHLGDDLVAAAYLLAGRKSNARSIASFFRRLLQRGRVRDGVALSPEELSRVAAPVLLVWGDDDSFLAPQAATSSIGSIPDAQLVRLASAGHAPWLQKEAETVRAISVHLA